MITNEEVLAFQDGEGEWKPIPKVTSTVPFGYKIDPDNDKQLLPIPLELEALELAKKHLKNHSYRDVAAWLSEATGRRISHEGFYKRVQSERRRKSKSSTIKIWAAKLKKALETVEELEQEGLGSKFKKTTAD